MDGNSDREKIRTCRNEEESTEGLIELETVEVLQRPVECHEDIISSQGGPLTPKSEQNNNLLEDSMGLVVYSEESDENYVEEEDDDDDEEDDDDDNDEEEEEDETEDGEDGEDEGSTTLTILPGFDRKPLANATLKELVSQLIHRGMFIRELPHATIKVYGEELRDFQVIWKEARCDAIVTAIYGTVVYDEGKTDGKDLAKQLSLSMERMNVKVSEKDTTTVAKLVLAGNTPQKAVSMLGKKAQVMREVLRSPEDNLDFNVAQKWPGSVRAKMVYTRYLASEKQDMGNPNKEMLMPPLVRFSGANWFIKKPGMQEEMIDDINTLCKGVSGDIFDFVLKNNCNIGYHDETELCYMLLVKDALFEGVKGYNGKALNGTIKRWANGGGNHLDEVVKLLKNPSAEVKGVVHHALSANWTKGNGAYKDVFLFSRYKGSDYIDIESEVNAGSFKKSGLKFELKRDGYNIR